MNTDFGKLPIGRAGSPLHAVHQCKKLGAHGVRALPSNDFAFIRVNLCKSVAKISGNYLTHFTSFGG